MKVINELFSFLRLSESKVEITFNDEEFISTKRSELYSFTDFIASFGGILGVFLGVSILSVVEIIYFLTVRKAVDGVPTTNENIEKKTDEIVNVDEIIISE